MAADDARRALLELFEQWLGPERARELMAYIPPHRWEDLATKHDLYAVREELLTRVEGRFEGVDGHFAAVGDRFEAVSDHFAAVNQRLDGVDERFDVLLAVTGQTRRDGHREAVAGCHRARLLWRLDRGPRGRGLHLSRL